MLKSSDTNKRKKKLLISNILLILSAVLLIGGIIYLSSDMIKRHKRNAVIQDATSDMEQVIAANMAAIEAAGGDDSVLDQTEMTLVIDPNAIPVNGEEYDLYSDTYAEQARSAGADAVNSELDDAYTGYLTLRGIGIIDIPCIDCHIPIWETTNTHTLRYGAGHYVNSVLPGSYGNCTIMGHHLIQYGGIFNRLEEVGVGDIVNITDIRGHQYTYFVDETMIVTPSEMLEMISGGITDTRQLTLVTCVYTSEGKMRYIVIGHIQDGT